MNDDKKTPLPLDDREDKSMPEAENIPDNSRLDVDEKDTVSNLEIENKEYLNDDSNFDLGHEMQDLMENQDDDHEVYEPETEIEGTKKKKKKKKKKKRKGGCLKSFIYVGAVCLISFLLAGGFLYCANDIFAISKPDKKVVIYIEQNWTTKQIAQALKKEGVIKSELLYRFYSRMSESDGKYQYGEYVLNTNYDYRRISSELKKIAPKKNEVKLVFQEGITANEIIDKLVKEVGCDREKLLEAMNNDKFGYSFVDDLAKNENRYIKVEGYLFPDTYNFFIGEPEHSVIKRFLDNFNKKWTNEFQQRADELGFSIDEVINIASMIQKEAKFKEDFPLVSSVFHNRLNKPSVYPNLQMDSTRDYCNNFIMPYLLTGDRERYNAYYNTYRCKGLPAGAISNPGVEAIEATLYPEETDYYYFVSDKNGKNYYGKTLLEHNKNIQKAKSVK